ncbi:helix-turn-helix transcriptional regulator [Saccharothrix australiensis]|uniref:Putative DNA-binding transcriptional regulator YafY n=1 Tax=Saccharothrix australiensis TaxID=2072 RepID=A0A495W5Z3_9PSEU|nr:WYL domain-containing protein [Saccharothrix australiensis]RKT56540.1 putative DNA-binding transcriptional regulator YafY [Saccharothrix australiensis]
MRAGRLLSLLLLLQSRGRLTARELADELEVSVRTVYRDVEALGAAGVPVYADRGPAGGYRLLDGYRTRLTGLTGQEADSLFLTGMPGPASELGLGEVVAAAQLKLLAALPPELRSRAGRIRERFHLDTSGWFRQAEEAPFLTVVADAVWSRRRLRVRYRRWGGPDAEVERVVGPLGIVLKGGLWYLVAEVSGEPRTYRVSRVLDVRDTGEPFDPPEGFDLADFWAGWSVEFERRMYPVEVTVRLTATGLARARCLLGAVAARALEGVVPTGEWTTVRVPVESLDHALVDLLRLGPDLEVVEPLELRERMKGTLEAMVVLYGPSLC